jgi:hypothetical protein
MVQATNMGKRYNISELRRFNGSRIRRIFVQRQVRSASMVIAEVFAKDSAVAKNGQQNQCDRIFRRDRLRMAR